MATKNYMINDKWLDLGKENQVNVKSVDGIITSITRNGNSVSALSSAASVISLTGERTDDGICVYPIVYTPAETPMIFFAQYSSLVETNDKYSIRAFLSVPRKYIGKWRAYILTVKSLDDETEIFVDTPGITKSNMSLDNTKPQFAYTATYKHSNITANKYSMLRLALEVDEDNGTHKIYYSTQLVMTQTSGTYSIEEKYYRPQNAITQAFTFLAQKRYIITPTAESILTDTKYELLSDVNGTGDSVTAPHGFGYLMSAESLANTAVIPAVRFDEMLIIGNGVFFG